MEESIDYGPHANGCLFVSRKEIAELRGELDEEKQKRMSLQVTSITAATHRAVHTHYSIRLNKY